MTVHSEDIGLKTRGNNDIVDVTGKVAKIVGASAIADGVVTVFVSGSTAGVTTIEYESGMVIDLKRFLDEWVPAERAWKHNHGGDTNGHAHVRAALIGPSVSVPVRAGRLALGQWQHIVLVDCDDGPRERTVVCTAVGD